MSEWPFTSFKNIIMCLINCHDLAAGRPNLVVAFSTVRSSGQFTLSISFLPLFVHVCSVFVYALAFLSDGLF